jgi:hypothetical protein
MWHSYIIPYNYSNKNRIKNLLLAFFISFYSIIIGQNTKTNIFIGTELTEMAGVPFNRLGSENYALMGGASFRISDRFLWGFRGISIKKQWNDNLSGNRNNPYGIVDFKGIDAQKKVERVYFDGYYSRTFKKLKIEPGLSLGLGHNFWEFTNERLFERYVLQTNVLSVGGRVRFTVFEYPFIELGSVDAFAYTWKSNDTSYQMGESQITLHQRGGIFNWIFAGVNIPLK